MQQKALITGVLGQDGSYLSEFLFSKGYQVYGTVRPGSDTSDHGFSGISIIPCDMSDEKKLTDLVRELKPDEIYNLAGRHMRGDSTFEDFSINAYSPRILLEGIRQFAPQARFFQAGSSEMFGNVSSPQSEETPFNPVSAYGISKLSAFHFGRMFRESHGLFVANGILFNHESPRRGESFVTRKITLGVTEILVGKRDAISLGNLDAKRDWGYAPEYVEAMWRMLQQDKPDDYVIATGEVHSVREFVEECFRLAKINDWQRYIKVDHRYYRPTEGGV
ncbi:MAG: GDP-mannose 4,6-dehydratase, partial [bacterium]|nr:GDP-mannose 4,6-dehydratase [bacterium]